MVQLHDEAVASLQNAMPNIKDSIVTKVGEKDYEAIEEALANYLEVDQKIIDLGATTDETASKQAQDMAFDELIPAYMAVEDAFQSLMDANIKLGDSTQSTLNKLEVVMVVLIIVIIIVSFVLATRIGRKIAHGIAQLMDELAKRLETFA